MISYSAEWTEQREIRITCGDTFYTPLLNKVGIERKARCHGFHLFRHSGGSAVSIACGIKVGQEYLRHQDYKTTANVYWHLDDAALRQATELLAGQIVGAMGSDRIASLTVEEQKMEQLLQ
jgi:integrase